MVRPHPCPTTCFTNCSLLTQTAAAQRLCSTGIASLCTREVWACWQPTSRSYCASVTSKPDGFETVTCFAARHPSVGRSTAPRDSVAGCMQAESGCPGSPVGTTPRCTVRNQATKTRPVVHTRHDATTGRNRYNHAVVHPLLVLHVGDRAFPF